jgi:hypothetical protein
MIMSDNSTIVVPANIAEMYRNASKSQRERALGVFQDALQTPEDRDLPSTPPANEEFERKFREVENFLKQSGI